MTNKVVSIEDRVPKLKEQRRKKTNRRMITLVCLFFLLIICIIYFQSPLSRVQTITVTGNQLINKKEIIQASGLSKSTTMLNVRKNKIENRVSKIPEIKDVHVKTNFPNKVLIDVTEHEVVGFLEDDHVFFPLLENGQFVKKGQAPTSAGPLLINFHEQKTIQIVAKELKNLQSEIRNSISEIIYSPKKTDSNRIIAYMNDGYEVHATLRTFAEKMAYYPALVQQLNPEDKGVIDLEVGLFFRSYDSEKDVNDEVREESDEINEN